jgi:hypothetical protein
MLCFGASLNAIPWCYSAEILPLRVRAQGTSLAVMNNWLWVCYPQSWLILYDTNYPIGLRYCHGHPDDDRKHHMEGVFCVYGLCK